MTEVSFPGLGIDSFKIDSVAFEIFGVSIAWYGVIITLGMVLAYFYCQSRAKYEGIKSDDMIDLAIVLLVVAIAGARLYYVIFEFDRFVVTSGSIWQNIWQTFVNVLNIRKGGLAIYGGIIAGFFASWAVAKKKKIKFPVLLDVIVGGLLLGQMIGRWGNFMNGEAFGYETDVLWRMGLKEISGGGIYSTYVEVHPTFLYESLWNLVGFIILNIFYKKKKFSGQMFAFYLMWYGLGRAIIEAFRSDSLYLFGSEFLRVSQLVSVTICFIGIVITVLGLIKVYKNIDIWAAVTAKLPKKNNKH